MIRTVFQNTGQAPATCQLAGQSVRSQLKQQLRPYLVPTLQSRQARGVCVELKLFQSADSP